MTEQLSLAPDLPELNDSHARENLESYLLYGYRYRINVVLG